MDSGADALHADRYKASVIRILQIDDASIFNIYRIAEEFGWRVNVTFREKRTTTEAADAETPVAEAPKEETPEAE